MAQTAGQAGMEQEERIHVEFLLCIGSRAKKKSLCAKGGWPVLDGGRAILVLRPPSLLGWTMGPLVVGVGGQVAPSVMRFLGQEACDPKTSASSHRRWGGPQSIWKLSRDSAVPCLGLEEVGVGGPGSESACRSREDNLRGRGGAAALWPSGQKQARDLAILSCVPSEETAWSWRGLSAQLSLPLCRHTSQRRTSGKGSSF